MALDFSGMGVYSDYSGDYSAKNLKSLMALDFSGVSTVTTAKKHTPLYTYIFAHKLFGDNYPVRNYAKNVRSRVRDMFFTVDTVDRS